MATLIIGDFRALRLQNYPWEDESRASDFSYLIEDSAEYSWFSTSAIAQLPLKSLDIENIVIALGFNDCAYSCAWDCFDIDQIATKYYNTITEQLDQYAGLNFYFCSVNPIESDYPFSEYSDEVIPVNILNKKIVQFNNKIKELCIDNVSFIDSYSYLNNTSFKTYDGTRFDNNTSLEILNYISSQLQSKISQLGGMTLNLVRDTSDMAPDPNEESFIYLLDTH